MGDKRRERFQLEMLRRAMPEVPRTDPTEAEPPDFLFATAESTLGIEFTEFHLPPEPGKRPYQEQQALKKRVVDQAAAIHARCGGPDLYVGVHFNDQHPLDKRRIVDLAHEIANSVLHSRLPTSITEHVAVPWRERPKEVAAIQVSRMKDDSLWYADAGGWVVPLTPNHVDEELRRKAPRLAVARTRCDRLWLVIVNESLDRAAAAESSPEMLSHVYDADCDRLLWLVASIARATELRLRARVA